MGITMLYFIVETPYEKCFELFFQDELGYPNFYRMSELITPKSASGSSELVLIAPLTSDLDDFSNKIIKKVNGLGVRYHAFGKGIKTQFTFHDDGKVRTEPRFQQALSDAVQAFYQTY